MALLYFVDTIIHYIRHKSKHFNPHFFKTTNQSLTKIGKAGSINATVPLNSQSALAGATNINLSPGTYILIATATFPTNGNGSRSISLGIANSLSKYGIRSYDANQSSTTSITINIILKITSNTNVVVGVQQDSGAKLKGNYVELQYIQIK